MTAATVEIKRDRWERPLIIPMTPDGPDLNAKTIPYTRVSTLAEKLEDKTALSKWAQRVVALGIARDRTLYQSLTITAAASANPLEDGKDQLTRVTHRAFILGGGEAAADAGTNFHRLSELDDTNELISEGSLPIELYRALKAYRKAIEMLEVVATELFVVNDEVRSAGTLDRLYKLPDGRVVVGDVKTGKDHEYPSKVMTQCATYARGKRYDPATGERSELHEALDPSTGLLVSVSLTRGTCTVYEIDLNAGWERAKLAAKVRDLPGVSKLAEWIA